MPIERKLTHVPDSDVEQAMAGFLAEGCTVRKESEGNGLWTVIANCPDPAGSAAATPGMQPAPEAAPSRPAMPKKAKAAKKAKKAKAPAKAKKARPPVKAKKAKARKAPKAKKAKKAKKSKKARKAK
jgi:hypothetical protein